MRVEDETKKKISNHSLKLSTIFHITYDIKGHDVTQLVPLLFHFPFCP